MPPKIETERLLLRAFQAGDVADALAYRDDRELARFLSHIPQPFTRRDAEAFVALNMSEPWQRSPTFAVVWHATVIGTVNLARIWASTDARHVRSQRVLEKLGMQREALRVADHVGRNGALADEVVYGLNLTR